MVATSIATRPGQSDTNPLGIDESARTAYNHIDGVDNTWCPLRPVTVAPVRKSNFRDDLKQDYCYSSDHHSELRRQTQEREVWPRPAAKHAFRPLRYQRVLRAPTVLTIRKYSFGRRAVKCGALLKVLAQDSSCYLKSDTEAQVVRGKSRFRRKRVHPL